MPIGSRRRRRAEPSPHPESGWRPGRSPLLHRARDGWLMRDEIAGLLGADPTVTLSELVDRDKARLPVVEADRGRMAADLDQRQVGGCHVVHGEHLHLLLNLVDL